MLFAGRFADLHGRKLLFLVGLGLNLVFTALTPIANVSKHLQISIPL